MIHPRLRAASGGTSHVNDLQGMADCGQYIHVSGAVEPGGLRVWRSYTPISRARDVGFIDLAVKLYEGGKLSKVFSELVVGQCAFMRGPRTHYTYSPYVRLLPAHVCKLIVRALMEHLQGHCALWNPRVRSSRVLVHCWRKWHYSHVPGAWEGVSLVASCTFPRVGRVI